MRHDINNYIADRLKSLLGSASNNRKILHLAYSDIYDVLGNEYGCELARVSMAELYSFIDRYELSSELYRIVKKENRRRNRMKNRILKTVTAIVAIAFYFCVGAIETNIIAGLISSLLCLGYLILFAMANNWGNKETE